MVSLILHACVLCVAGIQHSCTDEGNSMITLCAGCEMKHETNTNTLTAQRMIENIASAIKSLHSNTPPSGPLFSEGLVEELDGHSLFEF